MSDHDVHETISGRETMFINGKKVGQWVGMAVLLGAWLVGAAWAEDLKVGSVDIQKAVNECQAGKEAKKRILTEVEKFQRQVGDKQKELQALKESLEKQAPMLTAEARATKEKDYQNRLKDFQRWGEDSQNDLNQKRAEMERKIAIDLFKVVQKIGADENYTFILEKNENIVLFANKSTDLTDRVIRAYDTLKK
jgi:outer membrane protein